MQQIKLTYSIQSPPKPQNPNSLNDLGWLKNNIYSCKLKMKKFS